MASPSRRRAARALLTHLLLAGTTGLIVLPVLYALQISTLSFQEVFLFPPRLTPGGSFLENLSLAWEKVGLGRLLVNSALVSVVVAFGKICLSVLAAFAFTYFRNFRGKGVLFVLILITHMLPLPVRIVPSFQLMETFGWVNSYLALTVPFLASATGTLLFRQFFLTIPPSLSDAARVDGAGPLRFLVRILLPLSRNNVAALFMVEFLYMWNEYLWPLIITTTDEMRVVQIGIKMLVATDAQAEWNIIMAGVVMAMIPPLVVLVVLQRSFVRSVVLGHDK